MSDVRLPSCVADAVIGCLADEGVVSATDCSMLVAPGLFAPSLSRRVRVLVCMDRDRSALERIRGTTREGCRTELFEKDWMTYVPARGRYDSVVFGPSRLCFDRSALERAAMVSKRGCAAILPKADPYAELLCDLKGVAGDSVAVRGSFRPEPVFFGDGFPDFRIIRAEVECGVPFDELSRALSEDSGIPEDRFTPLLRRRMRSAADSSVYRYDVAVWRVPDVHSE